MRELSHVELTLENFDFIDVPANKISYLSLDGITRELEKHHFSSNIEETEYCKSFSIHIENPKDIKACNFLGEVLTLYDMVIGYPDITIVTLVYEDGSKEDYRVEFSEGSFNDYQHNNYLERIDELRIVVDKDFDSEQYPI